MVQHGQRFWALMLQSLNVIQYFLHISGCDSIQGTDFLGFSWLMTSMYGPTWHIFNGIFMTHEIEIIISHFSRPLKSFSVTFMAHGIYNTPTFHGSWTLVPDISWQFHEPWKPLSTFHRKSMAWKIGHKKEISVFRALKNDFLGFKWHFHGIFITLQFIIAQPFNRFPQDVVTYWTLFPY